MLFKKIILAVASVLGIFLGSFLMVQAATCAGIFVGGTGVCFGNGFVNGIQAHAVLIGEGSNPIGTTSPNTAGFVLTSNGINSDPTFQTISTGSLFPFTPTTNFNAPANATGTPIWFQAGIQASTTLNYFAGLTSYALTLPNRSGCSGTSALQTDVNGNVLCGSVSGGIASVANGGTGTTTFQNGDILTYNSSLGLVTAIPDVSINQVLISGGIGSIPSYSANPALNSVSTSVAFSGPVLKGGGLAGATLLIQGTTSGSPTTPAITIEAAPSGLITTDTLTGFGIGTSTPTQTLSVQGNQYTSGSAFFGGSITATSTFTLSALGAGTANLNSNGQFYSTATSSLLSGTGITITAGDGALIGGINTTVALAALASGGVLGNPVAGVPTVQATSTLYGAGIGGQVLGWNNNTNSLTFVATSSGLTGTVGIINGGTGTTTAGVTNGVEYSNGFIITNNANFTTDGLGNVNIGNGTIQWQEQASSTLSNFYTLTNPAISGSPFVTINSLIGNFGLATTAPDQLLAVNGNIDMTGNLMYNDTNFVSGSSTLTSFFAGTNAGAGFIATATSSTQGYIGNTGIGYGAMQFATSTGTAGRNTAVGSGAMAGANVATGGTFNADVAVGYQALGTIQTGRFDNFFGELAGSNLSTASNDNCVGTSCMGSITSGGVNNDFGNNAGFYNQTGTSNVGFGDKSDGGNFGSPASHQQDVSIGANAGTLLSTGGGNVLIGFNTGSTTTTGADNIEIGYDVSLAAGDSNKLDIGNLIFGTGLTSQASTSPLGSIGIGTTSPYATLSVDVGENQISQALSTIFAVGSTTSTGGHTTLFSISSSGHLLIGGAKANLTSCGSTNSLNGNDEVGTIIFTGTLVAACTLNFAQPVEPGNTLTCTESDNVTSVGSDITGTTTTSVTFGFASGIGGATIWYNCSRNVSN